MITYPFGSVGFISGSLWIIPDCKFVIDCLGVMLLDCIKRGSLSRKGKQESRGKCLVPTSLCQPPSHCLFLTRVHTYGICSSQLLPCVVSLSLTNSLSWMHAHNTQVRSRSMDQVKSEKQSITIVPVKVFRRYHQVQFSSTRQQQLKKLHQKLLRRHCTGSE